ncbi:unnamed protein product [Heligmosomoides polygyrus]|uniref:DUF3375 domain-containing protein n=1 Tax=Heligmosomoides polygyrus TaxID=6339 RepID=A0A183FP69_HELPZ|nr:unnamed protein product [Heligmosomoides polygyrus]
MPKLDNEPQFFENVLNGHGPDMNRSISTKALLYLLDFLTDGRYEKDIKKSDGYAELKRSFKSKKSANLQQSLNKFAGLVEELVDEYEEEARDYFREKEQYLKNIVRMATLVLRRSPLMRSFSD